MSREKQIEEMARDVTRSIVWDSDGYAEVDCLATAQNLCCIGYRKQSENTVEFPFKVGDMVYVPWCYDDQRAVATVTVEEIRVYDSQMHYMFFIDMESDNECFNQSFGGWKTEQSIGKTVFLTREEAEKALKERSKNAIT